MYLYSTNNQNASHSDYGHDKLGKGWPSSVEGIANDFISHLIDPPTNESFKSVGTHWDCVWAAAKLTKHTEQYERTYKIIIGGWGGGAERTRQFCRVKLKPSKYVPRSVMLDLESTVIDNIRAHVYGGIFKPDAFIMVRELCKRGVCVHTMMYKYPQIW